MSGRDPWLGVEPRHLATFAAVADAGSFRGAAARLGYVQSAVSQQIAQLERSLDTRLIERGQGNRDLRLTPAGRTLLAHARRIVERVQAACADVAYLAGAGPVRIAVEPAATSLLSSVSLRFAAARAQAGVAICEVPGASQPQLVASGLVDVGVGSFSGLGPGLSRRVICDDQWVLVVPEGSPMGGEGVLSSPVSVLGATIIEDRSHPLPVDAAGLGADRVISCDRLAIAIDLVRAGVGCAILPELGVASGEPGVRLVDLGDQLPARAVSMIWLTARRLPGELTQLSTAELRGDDDRCDGELEAAA
jgi:DNA-binding transcriptional LysR family regulator